MNDGIIGLVSTSHFMDSEREAMSGRVVVDEEEEFYDCKFYHLSDWNDRCI